MRSKLLVALFCLSGFLPFAQADTTPTPSEVRISCVCVGHTYTDGSGCTYVALEESGINVTTGQVVWQRTPSQWGTCNTNSANDLHTCQENLRNEPLCH